MLVAPAVMAATNMSPERRVSWPTTSEPPAPTIWWAVARPSAYASDGPQVDVGGTADAVGAEQAGHAGSSCAGVEGGMVRAEWVRADRRAGGR